MDSQNIRIRLKAFDHRVLDQSTGDSKYGEKNWCPSTWPNSSS